MTSSEMPESTNRVSFGDLPQFSDIFRTYCDDFSKLSDHYAGDFRDPEAIQRVATEVAAHPRDRDTLVRVLRKQNAQWGAREKTLANISRLLDPESVTVVTGQQVGLLTGPLYTVLKTVTAIQVARDLEERTGRPVIPVFWLEGEDHDVAEATDIVIPSDDGPVHCSYVPSHDTETSNPGPVGRLLVDSQFDEFVEAVESALPPTEFRDGLIESVRTSYQAQDTLLFGFARYLRTLFPDEGLVFLSSDDPELKELLKPLFRKELEDSSGSYEALMERTNLVSKDYVAQISPKQGNLFVIEEDGRLRVDPSPDGFVVKGSSVARTLEQMLEQLDADPSRFSPNVALRPLAQDTLLPTAIYVAGPGEIAYFAQLKGLYEWAGIPMPVIYPRASVTFVEPRIRRVMDREELNLQSLSGDLNELIRITVLESVDVDVEEVFSDTKSAISDLMGGLKIAVQSVDASLAKSTDATLAGMTNQLDGLMAKTVRSAKRQQDQVAEGIERVANHLLPANKLQERVVSPIYMMTKYGPELPVRWISDISIETSSHQIVELERFGT